MVIPIDRTKIDSYVAQPGVALIHWRGAEDPMLHVFDAGYVNVSARHPDVRFAALDVASDPALAASWGVVRGPELMAYRDGTLVFDFAGALPEPLVETLIDAIWSLDMARVRQGVDGHGARLYLSVDTPGGPRFDMGGGGAGEAPTGTPVKQ